MWHIKNIISRLDESMQRSVSNVEHQLATIGTFACIGFPLFYLIWVYYFPQPYENALLRLFGSLLGFGLMTTPYWAPKYKKYLSWYWFLVVLFCLSFFFSFMFLMNQASVISAMSLLCAVFFLILFLDLFSVSIILLLGTGVAILGYYMASNNIYLGEEHVEMTLVILFTIIVGSTLNYKTAMLQEQKLAGMAAAAGMIAHELRTPLLGIKSGAQALVRYLPEITNGYQLAKDHELLSAPLRARRLQQLEGVSSRIVSEIDYANTIIDMLLVKAGGFHSLHNSVLDSCSMHECLTEAIARYPFQSPKERALIHVGGDFQFKGSKLLMQHVLFNLIKNALYVIATTQRGAITIWTTLGDKFNYLYFKDTAKGMTNEQLSQLFNHFYTTHFLGTGIGLSFCKLVMHNFNGNIICESVEGEYALFILSFPVVH